MSSCLRVGRGWEGEGETARACAGITVGLREGALLLAAQGPSSRLWISGLPARPSPWEGRAGRGGESGARLQVCLTRRQVRLVATLGRREASGCGSSEPAAWQPCALPEFPRVSVGTGVQGPLAAVAYRTGSIPQWSRELCHLEFLGSTFLHWSLSHSRIRLCYWPLAPASFCRRSERQQK